MISTGQEIVAEDFINEAERDVTPANDAGRVPKLEADGRLSGFFTRNGQVLTAGATINGGTLPVPVYQNKSDNELYACDGNDLNALKFIGFAISNSTNGNPINFQGSGIVTGFSGLAEGEKYYVQDAVGTIGTTPGTYEILVGVAISETDLLIQKGRRHFVGEIATLGTASGSEAVECGFRPSIIRFYAANGISGSEQVAFLVGLWTPGQGLKALTFHLRSSGFVSLTNSIRDPGDSDGSMALSIGSVTDSGFTLSWTEANAYNPNTDGLIYEVEGEL